MKQQRMTKQKRLILEIAQSHHDHPTADQLYLEVRAADGRISRGTVYRDLEQLSESGDLLYVKVPGANRYDSRLDYHYHIVCRSCGAVCDVPLPYQYETDRQLSAQTGFQVERHRTIFEGVCPACLRDRQEPAGSRSSSAGDTLPQV